MDYVEHNDQTADPVPADNGDRQSLGIVLHDQIELPIADPPVGGDLDIFETMPPSHDVWADVGMPDMPPNADDISTLLSGTYGDFTCEGFDVVNETHGTPVEDMAFWDHQEDVNSCAVATTNMLFHSIGIDFGESNIADEFQHFQIYDPASGTDVDHIDDVVNLMCMQHGIDAHACEFRCESLDDLKSILDKGIRPLIAVDAADYVDNSSHLLHELGIIPGSPHAVQLIGIENDSVVINDPGLGSGIRIPSSVFQEARADMGFKGVALVPGPKTPGPNVSGELTEPLILGLIPGIPGAEPLSADQFGHLYRGKSIIPIANYERPH